MLTQFKKYIYYVIAAVIVVLIIAGAYWYFATPAYGNDIVKAALEYKAAHGSYGTVNNPKNPTCIERNSFLFTPGVQAVYAAPGVDSVSCKFTLDGATITAWSVSLVSGERVTCADSTGTVRSTPGLTLTPSCSGK